MAFKIPLQSEVQAYIQEKKGWPEKFCQYYANRFWDFYNSNGWKVGGRAPMKSWQSAFNAQWQVLKFKEDIDFLNACLKVEQVRTVGPGPQAIGNDLMGIDELLAYYEKNWEKVEDIRLARCYDTLKPMGLIRLSTEEGARAKNGCGGDTTKGKAICVKIMFEKMITRGMTFQKLANAKPGVESRVP
jgi:hypothetical protein